ncbi:unnamed protein product [Staurois parvus]|uniref:Uncharacterized protein n=1 Tax=Staurois parvus TaxID=386267 RepID=A0ABN9G2N9_9NEOB|nr:unnamed protein product [Staurois parvus]
MTIHLNLVSHSEAQMMSSESSLEDEIHFHLIYLRILLMTSLVIEEATEEAEVGLEDRFSQPSEDFQAFPLAFLHLIQVLLHRLVPLDMAASPHSPLRHLVVQEWATSNLFPHRPK